MSFEENLESRARRVVELRELWQAIDYHNIPDSPNTFSCL